MKYFNNTIFRAYLSDIQQVVNHASTPEDVVRMLQQQHVARGKVNRIPRDFSRIGIIDLNDLIQEANRSLIETWKRVDWEVVDNSDNPQATLGNFLSIRIEGDLKRFLNKASSIIHLPESQIRKQKEEQLKKAMDELKYSFKNFNWKFMYRLEDYAPGTTLTFAEIIPDEPDLTPWRQIDLNDKLGTIMFQLSEKERKVLRMFFGIDYDRKWKEHEIAKELNMSRSGVQDAKRRALKKLNTDNNKKLLQTFL